MFCFFFADSLFTFGASVRTAWEKVIMSFPDQCTPWAETFRRKNTINPVQNHWYLSVIVFSRILLLNSRVNELNEGDIAHITCGQWPKNSWNTKIGSHTISSYILPLIWKPTSTVLWCYMRKEINQRIVYRWVLRHHRTFTMDCVARWKRAFLTTGMHSRDLAVMGQ